jgi:hypothetical protein
MVVTKPIAPVVLTRADVLDTGSVAVTVLDAFINRKLSARVLAESADGQQFNSIDALAPGVYTLVISKPGYTTKRTNISVVGGETTHYNVSLVKSRLDSSELVVTLNWNDSLKDMDLHVLFKSNTTETCHVHYNHKVCGGA